MSFIKKGERLTDVDGNTLYIAARDIAYLEPCESAAVVNADGSPVPRNAKIGPIFFTRGFKPTAAGLFACGVFVNGEPRPYPAP